MRKSRWPPTYIYASCDPKFDYLSQPDIYTPEVDYMCFQMGPLRSIFLLCVNVKIRLKMGLFRPFYPQIGEFRWPGPDSTRKLYSGIFLFWNLDFRCKLVCSFFCSGSSYSINIPKSGSEYTSKDSTYSISATFFISSSISSTVRMKIMTMFSVDIHILNHYKRNFAHLSDFYSLVIGL